MAKKKVGRRSKLTPQLQKVIVYLIKEGCTIETTCATVGINKSTYYDWMKRGKKSKRWSRFRTFYEEVKQALVICELRHVAIISKAAEKDWRASAWWLERRHPEKWGKSKIEKIRRNNMEIDYDDHLLSVNYPYTKLNENEKSAIKSIDINSYVKIKNY